MLAFAHPAIWLSLPACRCSLLLPFCDRSAYLHPPKYAPCVQEVRRLAKLPCLASLTMVGNPISFHELYKETILQGEERGMGGWVDGWGVDGCVCGGVPLN